MRHFAVQRCARLTLYATLAHCLLACGADDEHGPPIGAPTGPVVNEGGSSNAGANAGGGTPGAGAPAIGGPVGASGAFGTAGAAASNPFGTAGDGSAGRDSFGIGGSGSGSDRFGGAGSPNAFAGTSFF